MKKLIMIPILAFITIFSGCYSDPTIFELVKFGPHTQNSVVYFNRFSVKIREIKDTTYVVRAIGGVDGRGIMQLNVLTSRDEFYTYEVGDKLTLKRK